MLSKSLFFYLFCAFVNSSFLLAATDNVTEIYAASEFTACEQQLYWPLKDKKKYYSAIVKNIAKDIYWKLRAKPQDLDLDTELQALVLNEVPYLTGNYPPFISTPFSLFIYLSIPVSIIAAIAGGLCQSEAVAMWTIVVGVFGGGVTIAGFYLKDLRRTPIRDIIPDIRLELDKLIEEHGEIDWPAAAERLRSRCRYII